MKPMKVQYDHSLRNRDTNLYTRSIHPIVHTRIAGARASVIRNLKVAIASGAHFGQKRLVLLQREVLADAPVPGEVLTLCKIEAQGYK